MIVGIPGRHHQGIVGVEMASAERAVRICNDADPIQVLMREAVFPAGKRVENQDHRTSARSDDLHPGCDPGVYSA